MSPSSEHTLYLRYEATKKEKFRASGLPSGQFVIEINDRQLGYPEIGSVTISAGAITEKLFHFE